MRTKLGGKVRRGNSLSCRFTASRLPRTRMSGSSSKARCCSAAKARSPVIRHAWTFDEMYSAFATQGFGKDGKAPTLGRIAPLAKVNVESLAEFDFFTYAKHGGQKPEFGAPIDYSLEADANKVITLHFTLPLKTPVDAKKPFSFQVYDPTYFVSFSFDKGRGVTLVGAPPGCSTSTLDPNPLVAADTQKLSEAFFSNMSPGADFGIKLASRVMVACP